MSEDDRSNKTGIGTNENEGMDSLREPLLLEAQAVPMPVSVPVTLCSDIETGDDVVPLVPSSIAPAADASGVTTIDAVNIDVDESQWDHGEVQPKAYRDCFWGFLFLLQFASVAVVGIMGVRNFISSFEEDSDSSDHSKKEEEDLKHYIWFCAALLGTVTVFPSVLLNLLLVAFSSMLIQISLLISPIFYFVGFISSFLTMNCPAALFCLIMSLIGGFYAATVWHKVPFATANLHVALASIRDNHGLWLLAYLVTLKSFAWFFLWCGAVLEMVTFSSDWVYNCNTDEYGHELCFVSTRGKFICLGMLLSLFWTQQVIKNIFHTTIAGVVGTWWFDPEEARSASARGNGGLLGCCGCSNAIWDSWIRSGFYSLGSIAFGSLLVGILKILAFVVRCGRKKRDQQRRMRGVEGTDFVFCLLQFFVERLESFVEYINVWAYVYVGLYGYDYWTAGKQVGALFRARGWDVIITDNLVDRSLSMMSSFIVSTVALVGMILAMVWNVNVLQAVFIAIVLGAMSCQVLFGVVISAVNTVVVCFAESPTQLNQNGHDPKLFRELVEAYRNAYPDDCGF